MLQMSQLLEMALSRQVHPRHLLEVCEDEACDRPPKVRKLRVRAVTIVCGKDLQTGI